MPGVILDQDGNPVADAAICSGGRQETVKSDREGRFRIRTDAPYVVIRKPGFESRRIRSIDRQENIVVTMARARRNIPLCSPHNEFVGLRRSAFCFPVVEGVWVTRSYSNTDSVSRGYFAFPNLQAQLTHDCCGYVCSNGFPSIRNIWESTEFTETAFSVEGLTILDARGKTKSGRLWHFLGRAGEYAAYNGYFDLSAKEAALLDRVLDGVCIQKAH